MKIIILFSLTLILSGCISAEQFAKSVEWSKTESLDPNDLIPTHLKPSVMFNTHAAPCTTPGVAALSDGVDFKYGCFCGANHPNIVVSRELYSNESKYRAFLTEKLLETAPLDDIDAACQRHDLCLAEFGFEVDCNVVLMKQLMKYNTRAKNRFGSRVSDAQRRCQVLAADLSGIIFTSLAPGNRGAYGYWPEWGTAWLPLAAPFILGNQILTGYPKTGEICN